MKISDLQAAPITINCYSCGKMEEENIGRLLLEPEMTIMINREDALWIAADFEQRCTIASKSVAVCCCGEPPAMNNQNARYNRNIGAQKRFY